jgi:hypothetical protein
MAIRTVKLTGHQISESTVDIVWDGAQVVTGAVTQTTPDENGDAVIATWTFEDNGATELTEHSLSISVGSGVLACGPLYFSTAGIHSEDRKLGSICMSQSTDPSGAGYWKPNNTGVFGDGSDTALADRSAILVNGAAPELGPGEATTGTVANPTWTGWNWALGAGDVLTCTARCPAQWVAPAPSAPV